MDQERAPYYQYMPLGTEKQDIRLLRLLPGAFDDDLRANIIHKSFTDPGTPDLKPSTRLSLKELQQTVPTGWIVRETIEGRYLFIEKSAATSWSHLDSNVDPKLYAGLPLDPLDDYSPGYEALSYTWGCDASLEPVKVLPGQSSAQSQSSWSCLQVRPSLAKALRYLRYPDKTRTLWIDAICINQNDIAERDRQVERMGDIYRRARHVVIWIGPESNSSSLALNTLRYLGKQVEHSVDHWYPSPDGADPQWGSPRCSLPFDEESWASLGDLLSRPYFERVWVKQEARLARHATVQCGFDTVPWNLFRRAILTLREKPSVAKSLAGLVNDVRELCNSRYLNDFFWLVLMSRKRKCANPRDKLYGILSLASPRLAQEIRPRYDKPLADVYKEALLAACAIGRRLDLLSHVNQGTASWESPSWVPDWSTGVDNTLQTTFFSPGAGMSQACYQYLAPGTLQVRGVCIETVCRVEAAIQGASDRIFDICRHADSLGLQRRLQSSCEDALLLPFLDLILINSTRERYPTNMSYPSLAEIRDRYLKESTQGAVALERFPEVRPSRLRNLSFMITRSGHLALAPKQTAQGDMICFLLGCHLPVVLRPLPSGYGLKLIGPCLIHGMIDGEAFLGNVPRPWRVEFYRDIMGYARLHFHNMVTDELVVEDPRLGPLPPEWECLDRDRSPDDPRWFACFRNKVTGETMNSDPRMLPEALEARGLKLETFQLV